MIHQSITRFAVLVLAIGNISIFISCNKDSVKDIKEDFIPVADFIDQPLKGKISDKNWTPLTAFTWEDNYYPNTITIQMSAAFFGDPCTTWDSDDRTITFRVGKTVAIHDVDYDFGSENIFYIMDGDLDFWVDAVEGKVELFTISGSEITGRLYAIYDNINYLHGNFTATHICE